MAKRNSGLENNALGSELYFQGVKKGDQMKNPPVSELDDMTGTKLKKAKVHMTYWVSEDTVKKLSKMRGQALIDGENVKVGELLDEAVQLLFEKRLQTPNEK